MIQLVKRYEVINALNGIRKYTLAEKIEDISVKIAIPGDKWFDYVYWDTVCRLVPEHIKFLETKVPIIDAAEDTLKIRQ